jgi:hypothetical protein
MYKTDNLSVFSAKVGYKKVQGYALSPHFFPEHEYFRVLSPRRRILSEKPIVVLPEKKFPF